MAHGGISKGWQRGGIGVIAGLLLATSTGRASAQDAAVPSDPPAPARAASAASAAVTMQPVIVTAQRTQTVLGRTPLSVGVVDQRAIDSGGTAQLSDLVGTVPGVTVPNGFSNQPQAVGIRGMGVSVPAMSQAVGIYVDDVPLIRGYATALWDLPDIVRIEVLRGPQGTLYGQNSTAGAVRVISIDPTRTPAAWGSVSVGNYRDAEVHGYVNGPIGDGPLSGSVALSSRRNDGFGYNASTGEGVNKLDATQFRAKLRLKRPSGLDAILAVDGLRDTSDTNTGNFPLNDPQSSPRVTFVTATPGPFKRVSGGLQLKVSHPLGEGIDFHSITGYRAYKDDPTIADLGGKAVLRYLLTQTVEQKAFSQELQLQARQDRLDWTAGLMLVSDRFDFDRIVDQIPLPPRSRVDTEGQTHLETTDVGLYGQAHYAWTDGIGLTAGLRAYRTKQTGDNRFWTLDADQQRTRQVYDATDLSTSSHGLLPRLGVDWQRNEDHFLYASFAMGQKFGGFNRATASETASTYATRPEKVSTWELGSKWRLAGGRLTADLALFLNRYGQYLASLQNTVINGVTVPDQVLVNAGRAKTYGADIDLAAKLAERTELALAVELLRSRIDAFANPTGAAISNYVGNQLPYASHVSLSARFGHVQPLHDGSSLEFTATVQHLSRQYADVQNTAAIAIAPQTYLNLATSWSSPDRGWTFSLRVRNVTNRTHVVLRTMIPSVDVDAANYNAPRTWVATLRHDF
nr:TonB-dependent receptor [uncultured Roseateles sp.]